MKLGDFLNSMAAKCGKQNDPALVAILSNSELANREVPDDFANALDTGLMSLDSAKNNPALKSHFSALALNGVDTEILNAAKAFGIADVSDIETDKNTFEKFRKLQAKIEAKMKKLEEAKGEGSSKDVEKYTKEINDLKAQVSKFTETHIPKTELDALTGRHNSELQDMLVRQYLSSKKYANDTLDIDTNIITAQTLLQRALADKKAILVKDGYALRLKRADDPNLDYYDEQNRAVTFEAFADGLLASKKLVAVSTGTEQPPVQKQVIISDDGKVDTSIFNQAIRQSQGDLNIKTQ